MKKFISFVLAITMLVQPTTIFAIENSSNSEVVMDGGITSSNTDVDYNQTQQISTTSELVTTQTTNVATPRAEPSLNLATPVVTDLGNGSVKVDLNWTVVNGGGRTWNFTGETVTTGVTPEFLPMKSNVRVLNVYPNVANIAEWLNDYGNRISGSSLTTTAIDWETYMLNPSEYILKKNNDGSYYYDVVFFGTWDGNASKYISELGISTLKTYLSSGGSAIIGHDMLRPPSPVTRFEDLKDVFGLSVYSEAWNPYTSRSVKVAKVGSITKYPYNIGDLGDILSIPITHTVNQLPLGTIWMYLQNGYGDIAQNAYLSTYNNTALIQTGHSSGSATEAEKQLLTNLAFMMASSASSTTGGNISTATATDNAKPNSTTISSAIPLDANTVKISYPKPNDNGTTWNFTITGSSMSDSKVITATKSATITSGIAGYSIVVDTNPSTVPDKTIETTNLTYNISRNVYSDYYVHISAVDYFGNVSTPTHYQWKVPNYSLTGKLVDQWNKPIEGVAVTYNGVSTVTNTSGVYTLTTTYQPTTNSITFSKTGYSPLSVNTTLIANTDLGSKTLSKQFFTVSGIVKDVKGNVIKNALIQINGSSITTDQDGKYSIDIYQ